MHSIALLKALGIEYESLSDFMVLRGKQYQRGPSFAKREYVKAAEYCLMSNMQGLTCILVDSFNEFTVWLQVQNYDLAETNQISQPQAVDRTQPSSQPASESKFQLTYRGVKYGVKQDGTKSIRDKPAAQNDPSPEQPTSDPESKGFYRGVVINS